ncbi:hypothetical protein GC101_26995 [Paenibacillus sp. LMG 31459]|uniref:Uncharacterized protein n=2 Tax=Paenibacillus phytohabitans TaxID=2654978 RepID=A0ABX1YN83_9BACL|nr:hypothetical protein [Paenibacillus phytohabitans]
MAAELKDIEMTYGEIAATLAGPYRLNKKEQRLLAYLLDDSKSRRVGDIRKALKTTSRTLLGKTRPELEKKIGAAGSESWKRNLEASIRSGSVSNREARQWVLLFSRKGDTHFEKAPASVAET